MLSDPVFALKVQKIETKLLETNNAGEFDRRLQNATYFLSSTFLLSSVLNYLLAKWVVTSPSGTAAFNEELGQMTLLSYPVIAVPSTLMMFAILYYLWRTINTLTGFKLEEILVTHKM